MDWSSLYPKYFSSEDSPQNTVDPKHQVEFADIGCGYGGLLGKFSHLSAHTF
jgi:tRNA (guanine-N7-)-methyltransferase